MTFFDICVNSEAYKKHHGSFKMDGSMHWVMLTQPKNESYAFLKSKFIIDFEIVNGIFDLL